MRENDPNSALLMADPLPRQGFDERTAAKLLGVSPRTLWKLRADGEIRHARIGRRVLYTLDGIRQFLADHSSEQAQSDQRGEPSA